MSYYESKHGHELDWILHLPRLIPLKPFSDDFSGDNFSENALTSVSGKVLTISVV